MMSKKKQVTFQSNTPGKFIPRDDPSTASVLHPGVNSTRFNSRMVELLASSSTVNNENEVTQNNVKLSSDEPILSPLTENALPDSSHGQSRVIQRRIVTMLESLRGRGGVGEPVSPLKTPTSSIESRSQPITFGQLRQATILSVPPPPSSAAAVVDEVPPTNISLIRSPTDSASVSPSHKHSYRSNVPISSQTDPHVDLLSTPINPIRMHYSSSLEQLLEQHNVVPRINENNERQQQHVEQPKSRLTVDEILATYYSKLKIPTTIESHTSSSSSLSQPPSYSSNNSSLNFPPSTLGWTPPLSQPNHPIIAPILLNEQNRNRPPPPSYSSSVTSGHRPPSSANKIAQHLIRLPTSSSLTREHVHTGPQITQHLSPGNPMLVANTSTRLPAPRYELKTNIERSHSALSAMTRPNYSPTNPPQAGFDREFSRLLYGKEGEKNRRQRQKRKAFSDPVKKSVEEAGRAAEKTHRRVTSHLNKTDTVKEEEETSSDSYEIDKHEQKLFLQKRIQRNRELVKTPIVPPNPILSRRIPSFLVTYSQTASLPNDILPQWHLCSLYELESYNAMMTKLYKDENLTRVKLYETYRALLTSVLALKILTNQMKKNRDNKNDDNITTTAL
ncbi:hypothetical protein I4U23_003199 [Adineta vaga]|nr:hypothetical protein I4U23_003199 [Adineta vaga]